MMDFESESRLANCLLKRCIEHASCDHSEVQRALMSPGAIVAIAKLMAVGDRNTEVLYLNLFRLGATVALSIRDAESIK
jgi:hypothetical protein